MYQEARRHNARLNHSTVTGKKPRAGPERQAFGWISQPKASSRTPELTGRAHNADTAKLTMTFELIPLRLNELLDRPLAET